VGKFPQKSVWWGLQVKQNCKRGNLTYSRAKACPTIIPINSVDFKIGGIVANFRTMLTGNFFPEIEDSREKRLPDHRSRIFKKYLSPLYYGIPINGPGGKLKGRPGSLSLPGMALVYPAHIQQVWHFPDVQPTLKTARS
jgi:hypothetical protein